MYLQPLTLSQGAQAQAAIATGLAQPLAGGPTAFSALQIVERAADGTLNKQTRAVADFRAWLDSPAADDATRRLWARLTQARPHFAGLDLTTGPHIMGIVNATPDSFSDGGDHAGASAAIGHGIALAEAGAQIIDIGGESTRPGADPVSPQDEGDRVIPVVTALAERGLTVSIDTRRASVMSAATNAGATIINDVSALGDPDSIAIAARSQASVILMHMRGEPKTMQAAPQYSDILLDVYDFLAARLTACSAAGIGLNRLCVDPGIGFGKTAGHNFTLIDALATFHGLGCPLLLGASRKSFIALGAGQTAPKDRLAGSLAAALAGADRGVQFLRVHDVAETQQALAIRGAITLAGA